ncbi:hypothetical protein LUZ60_001802 [Juncus effusus]|nr:hypothetical protein LUZ60_001802 [Juncus effusus]
MAVGAPPAPPPTTAPRRHFSPSVIRSRSYPLPLCSSSSVGNLSRIIGCESTPNSSSSSSVKGKQTVNFLDVNPLCFNGSKPSLSAFSYWIRLYLSKISHQSPVIAVLDGEEGNEYRRTLLPSYKSKNICRNGPSNGFLTRSEPQILELLHKLHIPVVKVKGYEADDTVATLTDQALENGYRVLIGSPDKDFKQLICDEVQMAMPIQELKRWCFYSLKHYIEQYGCDPTSDLSLRCFMGDEVDGVPGIQTLVPAIGRKTAVKLLKKHGSLDNLLNTAKIRTVGKDYIQNALIQHGEYLRRNYEVLSLRRDADVRLEEKWLRKRDCENDFLVLTEFVEKLHNVKKDVFKRSREKVTRLSSY